MIISFNCLYHQHKRTLDMTYQAQDQAHQAQIAHLNAKQGAYQGLTQSLYKHPFGRRWIGPSPSENQGFSLDSCSSTWVCGSAMVRFSFLVFIFQFVRVGILITDGSLLWPSRMSRRQTKLSAPCFTSAHHAPFLIRPQVRIYLYFYEIILVVQSDQKPRAMVVI